MNAIEDQWSTEDSENNPVLLQQQAGGSVSQNVQMQYRVSMINWSNQIRSMDPGYFCNAACQSGFVNFFYYPFSSKIEVFIAPKRERWFVCGVKRPSEIEWFKTNFGNKVKTVRVSTMENTTKENIWQVCSGGVKRVFLLESIRVDVLFLDVDDDVFEFDLENYNYDLKIYHSNLRELSDSLQVMVHFMQNFISN